MKQSVPAAGQGSSNPPAWRQGPCSGSGNPPQGKLSPLQLFGIRLVMVGLVALYIVAADPEEWLALVLIGVATVITVVTDHLLGWERWLEERCIPSRIAWAPLVMLAVIIALGYVSVSGALQVMWARLDIIAFILAFALLAQGLGRSRFFRYLATYFTERCEGNTSRLIVYLFLLTSVVTYLTSNDIVILVMTPIVVAVAMRANMRNAKLLLLSQFVAANTVSMGLLIGSPTNIIIGNGQGFDFLTYALLMFVPTLVALLATLGVMGWLNRLVEQVDRHVALKESEQESPKEAKSPFLVALLSRSKRIRSWVYEPGYETPRFSADTEFRPEMKRWVAIAALSLLVAVVVTSVGWSLFFAAVPILGVSVVALRREDNKGGLPPDSRNARTAVARLPYGILFFGLSFFVLAAAISSAPIVAEDLTGLSVRGFENLPLVATILAVLGSGLLTNILNDLPASALVAGMLEQASFPSVFLRALANQAALIGVNIGTYITPVGALAGIIWFQILRQESQSGASQDGRGESLAIPTRGDLAVYGFMMFIPLAILLGVTSYTVVSLADWLFGPTSGPSLLPNSTLRVVTTLAGVAVITWVALSVRRQLRKSGVFLTHMVDLFATVNRLRMWAARNRLGWALIVTSSLVVFAAGALYSVENFHASRYGEAGLFEGPGAFLEWFTVLVTSGFDVEDFPRSILGVLLGGLLTLGILAAILYLIRAAAQGPDLGLLQRMATGEVPVSRMVILNATDEDLDLVDTVLVSKAKRFIVIVGAPEASRRLRQLMDKRNDNMACFLPAPETLADAVEDLRLVSAREILLLNRSRSDDYASLAFLMALDEAMGRNVVRAEGRGNDVDEWPSGGRDEPAPTGGTATTQEVVHADFGVVCQAYSSDLLDLVRNRITEGLQARIRVFDLGGNFTKFIVAHTSADPRDLADFFTLTDDSAGGGNPQAGGRFGTGEVEWRGELPRLLEVELEKSVATQLNSLLRAGATHGPGKVPTRAPWALRLAIDELLAEAETIPPVGVVVDGHGVHDHLTLADLVEAATPRSVIRVVGLAPGGSDGDLPGDDLAQSSQRLTVLVGENDTLISATHSLSGSGRTVLVVCPPDAPRVAGLDDLPGVNVEIAVSEPEAVALLAGMPQGDRRFVVFDSPRNGAWSTDRILEGISRDRLALIRDGSPVAPMMVQCLSRKRRQNLRRFLVDEVVDSSWFGRSYLQALAYAYFDVLRGEESSEGSVGAGGDKVRGRFTKAHLIASRFVRFEVVPAKHFSIVLPEKGPQPVVGKSYEDLLKKSRVALGLSGPVIGGIRVAPQVKQTKDGTDEAATTSMKVTILSPLEASDGTAPGQEGDPEGGTGSSGDKVDENDLLLILPHL